MYKLHQQKINYLINNQYTPKYPNYINELINTKSQILYPGEQLFKYLTIQNPCILEKFIKDNNIILFIHDLEFYRLAHYEIELKEKSIKLALEHSIKTLNRKRSNTRINEKHLTIKSNSHNINKFNLYWTCKKINSENINFLISQEELISLDSIQSFQLNLLKKDEYYIPAYTCFGFFELLSNEKQNIEHWQLKSDKELFLFFNSNKDYVNYSTETSNFLVKEGDFVFKDDKLNSNLCTNISGQIKKIKGSNISKTGLCLKKQIHIFASNLLIESSHDKPC